MKINAYSVYISLILGGVSISHEAFASRYAKIAQQKLQQKGIQVSTGEAAQIRSEALATGVNGIQAAQSVQTLKGLGVANPTASEIKAAIHMGTLTPLFTVEEVKATERLQGEGRNAPSRVEVESEVALAWLKAINPHPTPQEIEAAHVIRTFSPAYIATMDRGKLDIALRFKTIGMDFFTEHQMSIAERITTFGVLTNAITTNEIRAVERLMANGAALATVAQNDFEDAQRLVEIGMTAFSPVHADALRQIVTFGIARNAVNREQIEAVTRIVAGGAILGAVTQAQMDHEIRCQTLRQTILADRVNYDNIHNNTDINKIITHFEGLGAPFPTDPILLAFAKKVNDEPLHRADGHLRIDNQIQAVVRAIMVLNTEYPELALDAAAIGHWNGALGARARIYKTLNDRGGDPTDNVQFQAEIVRFLGLINNAVEHDYSVTLSAAADISEFENALEEDRASFKAAFNTKRDALALKLQNGTLDPHRGEGPPDEDTEHGYTLGVQGVDIIDLERDRREVIAEIDAIALAKAVDPIRLNYKKLTYKNHASKIVDMDYAPVAQVEIEAIRDEMLSLVEDMGGNPAALNNEISTTLNRIRDHDRPQDYWKERVKSLWTITPNLVDVAIDRPGMPDHNPVAWARALREQKILMAQGIMGVNDGGNTGVNQKLKAIERGNAIHLTSLEAKVTLHEKISLIIRDILESRIWETGKNPDAQRGQEENMTAPSVLYQRLRLPFGLLGSYTHTPGMAYGLPHEAKNAPVQIVRNTFLPGQPARPYTTNGGIVNVPIEGEPLTVKSLVDAVYHEFGRSITGDDVHQFVDGNLITRRQYGFMVTERQPTVFTKLGGNVQDPRSAFKKGLAFAILERLGYIEMDVPTKTALYAYDENTNTIGTAVINGNPRTLEQAIDLF